MPTAHMMTDAVGHALQICIRAGCSGSHSKSCRFACLALPQRTLYARAPGQWLSQTLHIGACCCPFRMLELVSSI